MHSEVVDLILAAGEMLLTSGAEVYRTEETMERMGKALGYSVEAYVTPTGIFLTVGKDQEFLTRIRRIHYRTEDLGRIAGVNAISRELAKGDLTLQEASQRIKDLRGLSYTTFQRVLAVMVASVSFTFILGGRQMELIVAAIAGLIAFSVTKVLEHFNANYYLSGIASSFLVANYVYLAQYFFPEISTPLVLVGGLMVLVPGVAIASAVRDIVQGELLSGTSRAAEALAIAAALAAGSALALGLWRW